MKIVEGLAVVVALSENRFPVEARLRTFENTEFEQIPVVVNRHAPFVVMVGNQELRAGPSTTFYLFLAGPNSRLVFRRLLHAVDDD